MKKNILVIAPDTPVASGIEWFAHTLSFLEPHYNLQVIDPLSTIDITLKNNAYYLAWQQYLAAQLQQYDAFIGFSFGGVILQQCFPVFEHRRYPIILFSTPTFADIPLHQKLTQIIALCEKNQVKAALDLLYTTVYYPHQRPLKNWDTLNQTEAASRVINGLQRVLSTDATPLVTTTTVRHLHFIGECSNLVNAQNVLTPNTGTLFTVPKAGMRVLEDNLLFCQPLIMNELGCQHD